MANNFQFNVNIYTYGSLRLQQIWQLVTGQYFRTASATLADHVALKVRGETFPGLIQRNGETTEGLVYFEVDSESIAQLDEFESGIYERVPVAVRIADGSLVDCETYRVIPGKEGVLAEEKWDFEEFRGEFLDKFIRRNIGGTS